MNFIYLTSAWISLFSIIEFKRLKDNNRFPISISQVIYYVTGQIPKEQQPSSGSEDTPEHREPTQPSTQVSNVNANDNEQTQLPPLSPPPKSPPPISPKPVGLNGFNLPKKQVKRAESLKTNAEMQKGKALKKMLRLQNSEKKSKKNHENDSSRRNVIPEPVADVVKEAHKQIVTPPIKTSEGPQANLDSSDDGTSLSPDLPAEEAPPPPDNIAFMITNTKVQALSCGEYQELVSAKKGSVQTVTVGNATNRGNTADSTAPQDNGFNKKPVIIIFDEPMDIRSAYKRLSTIFECEEELERMLAEERIEEESEESDTDGSGGPLVKEGRKEVVEGKTVGSLQNAVDHTSSSSSSSISELTDSGENLGTNGDVKQDGKKKFKFRFPKKQLAALTHAIRAGTKSGKKTLQVVVYEDEEESDGTIKQHKETKRYEITRSKSLADTPKESGFAKQKRQNSDALCRTDDIRKSTYKTLDSLEQTIKQLETTISEMGPRSPDEPASTEDAKPRNGKISEGAGLKRSSSLPTSRGPGPKVSNKGSFQKKIKPQLLPRPVVIPSTTTTTNTTTVPSVPSTVQQVSL